MAKNLTIIAGILCLLGAFVFSWYGEGAVATGLGIVRIVQSFNSLISYGEPLLWIGYIMGIFTILSGVFILIGRKSRIIPILFGLIACIQMLIVILILYDVDIPFISEALAYPTEYFWIYQLGDIFPFAINLGEAGLGSFLLCIGGLLGFIGGLKNKK